MRLVKQLLRTTLKKSKGTYNMSYEPIADSLAELRAAVGEVKDRMESINEDADNKVNDLERVRDDSDETKDALIEKLQTLEDIEDLISGATEIESRAGEFDITA